MCLQKHDAHLLVLSLPLTKPKTLRRVFAGRINFLVACTIQARMGLSGLTHLVLGILLFNYLWAPALVRVGGA